VDWSPEDVVSAVRVVLNGSSPNSPWAFDGADLDGDGVLVRFQTSGDKFGVRYSFTEAPDGPSTGEPCDSPVEWADEVWIDMYEQVLTGGVARADRATRPDGLVLLNWSE
jgi:hypothetical protein